MVKATAQPYKHTEYNSLLLRAGKHGLHTVTQDNNKV